MPSNARPKASDHSKIAVIGMTRDALKQAFGGIGVSEKQQKMRASQLWHWLYIRGAKTFDEMTNISKDLRLQMADAFTIDRPEIISEQISTDGTRKWLLRFPSLGAGAPVEIETVYIPEEGRGTLCVSSQVGCTLACTFCHTGTQKMVRNLTAGEIIAQVLVARESLGDFPEMNTPQGAIVPGEGRSVSNVVMMGMGEPLYNFENVRDAMKIAMDEEGISLSRRRITLSTSGVVPEIARTAEEIGCMLAVSFHATTDEVRNSLVPINKRWNIETLLEALRAYPRGRNSERITFEYVMLHGVNDSDEDARRLVELIKGIPAKVNLIPFNEWPGAPYKRSSNNRIRAFSDIIFDAGYASPVRKPRGEDILAACGQLKSATERARKSRAQIESETGS
ncbi:MAG: 23S rRNA (adenine(2503)-C(2))-methyltransferase RlmN [Paracoccaceae bacterium]